MDMYTYIYTYTDTCMDIYIYRYIYIHIYLYAILFCDRDFSRDHALAHMYALHWYCIFQAHNKMRNEKSRFTNSIYNARMKQLAVQHEFSRRIIQYYRARGENPLLIQ